MNQLLTENIWGRITAVTKANNNKSYVAVAYFGKGGASMLPLNDGSYLVVDASEIAVKTGQTCPDELLKLYKQGIKIYSKEFLHAKVFVLGTKVFIGSTNVSSRSANRLIEITYTSNSRATVDEAKRFIKSLCKYELGPEELKQLQKIYRPPIIPGNRSSKNKLTPDKKSNRNRVYVANITFKEYPDGYEGPLEKGRVEAKKNWRKKARHFIDEFEWRAQNVPFNKGDMILQVVDMRDKKLMTAPGKVLHIKRWKNNKRAFIFLEQPNKRRTNINILGKEVVSKLKRDGYKSREITEKLLDFWQS